MVESPKTHANGTYANRRRCVRGTYTQRCRPCLVIADRGNVHVQTRTRRRGSARAAAGPNVGLPSLDKLHLKQCSRLLKLCTPHYRRTLFKPIEHAPIADVHLAADLVKAKCEWWPVAETLHTHTRLLASRTARTANQREQAGLTVTSGTLVWTLA